MMVLVIHIAVALASIMFSTFAFMRPSSAKVKGSYVLIGGTLATGTILILTTSASILRTCVMGLAYASFATVLTVAAQRKLAQH